MLDRGHRFGFRPEPDNVGEVRRVGVQQHLEGDDAVEPDLLGPVNHPHPPAAEFAGDHEAGDLGQRHRPHRTGYRGRGQRPRRRGRGLHRRVERGRVQPHRRRPRHLQRTDLLCERPGIRRGSSRCNFVVHGIRKNWHAADSFCDAPGTLGHAREFGGSIREAARNRAAPEAIRLLPAGVTAGQRGVEPTRRPKSHPGIRLRTRRTIGSRPTRPIGTP